MSSRRGFASNHPLYCVWQSMRTRCNCTSNHSFKRYGGRGISICKEWDDFWQFVADVGPRPSPDHSIDRIDNEGNYEPNNVRWATRRQQMENTRQARFIEFNNQRLTVTRWAEVFGITQSALSHRIADHGVEKAMRMGPRP